MAPVCSKGGKSLPGRQRLHGLPDTLIYWIVIYQVDNAFHPTSFGQLYCIVLYWSSALNTEEKYLPRLVLLNAFLTN